MTKLLTVRIDAALLDKAEARAARLGLDRSGYVRQLIKEDVESPEEEFRRVFVSEDLAGMFEGDGKAATNAAVRARFQKRAAR